MSYGTFVSSLPATSARGRDEMLDRPLQFAKGVGPRRAELLARLFLERVEDLLYFFPISHKDRASITAIPDLRAGTEVNVRAKIVDVRGGRTYTGKSRVEALLDDGRGELRAVWWNPYVLDKLSPGAWGFFSGKVKPAKKQLEFAGPDFEIIDEDGEYDEADGEDLAPSVENNPNFGRIVPIYSLRPRQRRPDGTDPPEVKLNQALLRRLIFTALAEGAAEGLREDLPEAVRKKRGLPTLAEAIRQIHFPQSFEHLKRARRRLAYEELFILSTGVGLRRAEVEHRTPARKLPLGANIEKRIRERMPFELTAAQARVFQQIAADMGGVRPMNRLLQGDVGSGKTAVAVASMLLAVAHGAQAALLAPTEVLAEQHVRTLGRMLQGSRVVVGLLRGGAGAKDRRQFIDALKDGRIHIAVGTHALLSDDVAFRELALVVVDEQHKFGVEQRSALRRKGRAPHVLVMTATPIPRTLSLTLYGDLDTSIIDERPPGRGEVQTRWVTEADRPKVYKRILAEAKKGHAAYIVLPRIDGQTTVGGEVDTGGEKSKAKKAPLQPKLWSEVKGVAEEVKRLRAHLPTLRVEALHGRMSSAEKDAILDRLRAGKIDVLVSTLVVEVGVDLPTATIMVIENAELFGISSLHQLRGRVGRSERKSWCLFFAHSANDDTKKRLKVFAATHDGFEIAEADFALRGPGQFFGTEQSGLPELLVADLLVDRELLELAREDAFELVKRDPNLASAEHAPLLKRVREVLGGRLGLVDVG